MHNLAKAKIGRALDSSDIRVSGICALAGPESSILTLNKNIRMSKPKNLNRNAKALHKNADSALMVRKPALLQVEPGNGSRRSADPLIYADCSRHFAS